MKHFGLIITITMVMSISCSFNFVNGTQDIIADEGLHTRIITTDTVQVTSWYDNNETLQYFEEGYLTGSRAIDQVQQYSAAGKLTHTYRYRYTAGGLVEIVAYYNAANTLEWFQIYTFDADKNIDTQAEYNGAGVLQWVRKYSYIASGAAAGKIEVAASFNGALLIDGATKYSFLPSSDKWNIEESYGTKPNAVAGICSDGVTAAEVLTAGPSNADKVASHGRISAVALPALPPAPSVVIPSLPGTLSVTGYRFAYYDEYGTSEVSINPLWYPVSALREDTRLKGKNIQVDLEYDS